MELSTEEKKILLKAARESIREEFSESEITRIDYKAYPKLKMELGAFVTLKIDDQLVAALVIYLQKNHCLKL